MEALINIQWTFAAMFVYLESGNHSDRDAFSVFRGCTHSVVSLEGVYVCMLLYMVPGDGLALSVATTDVDQGICLFFINCV